MKFSKLFFLFLILSSWHLIAYDPNIFVYGEGDTQVNSEINVYENLVAGAPIQGSVMITHNKNAVIDANSFRLGDKPLKVTLVQSVSMSSYSSLIVTIYQFQLEGMPQGSYILPSIKVKVDGKEFQAPPLSIQIGNR